MLLLLSGDISENPGPDVGHGSLSVLHLNIRSIRNKISYIEDCLTDFDILCFTETHLSNDVDISNLLIKGFRSPFRKYKSVYSGGILVYVADHILSERMANVEIFWDESVWIKVTTRQDSYYVCTIYRQPSSGIEFWDLLDRNLEFISEISNNIVVVGDINEDQLNVRNHKLKDIMLVNTMKNVIVSPTRITDTTSTLIDPIMVNQDQHILKCGVLDVPSDISDHKITFAIIPFEINSDVSYTRSVWNFKRADFLKFNELILNTDWSVLNNGNIDDAAELFTVKFIDLAKQCIPRKEVTIRPNDKPWYDSEIRRTSKLRDKARKRAIHTGGSNDWDTYKTIRNRVNNMKKYAREAFYNGIESELTGAFSNDKKYFWKLVRYFVKDTNTSNTIPALKDLDGNNDTLHISDIDKANCLNNFFVSISTLNDIDATLPRMILKTDRVLDTVTINASEIKDIIKILQVNKACGNDCISHKMLKGVSDTVSIPLAILFNKSLNECQFPAHGR